MVHNIAAVASDVDPSDVRKLTSLVVMFQRHPFIATGALVVVVALAVMSRKGKKIQAQRAAQAPSDGPSSPNGGAPTV